MQLSRVLLRSMCNLLKVGLHEVSGSDMFILILRHPTTHLPRVPLILPTPYVPIGNLRRVRCFPVILMKCKFGSLASLAATSGNYHGIGYRNVLVSGDGYDVEIVTQADRNREILRHGEIRQVETPLPTPPPAFSGSQRPRDSLLLARVVGVP